MGDSSRPDSGYDTETAAADISELLTSLDISRYSVIGHDIGMWIAYPLATRHGSSIDKLVVTEALIPGVTPTPPMLLPPTPTRCSPSSCSISCATCPNIWWPD